MDVNPTFPHFGLVRLTEIVAPNGVLPISRSSFLAGVKAGRFPQPVKLGPRTTAWDAAEICAFITALAGPRHGFPLRHSRVTR
ncbi:MAG: helix-turn-helix transcriptional regulator [Methylocella sp.]